MTHQDLKILAKDFVDGKVFLSTDPEEISRHFMVMMFIDAKELPNDLSAVFEYYAEAGPIGLNGKPLFMTARLLLKSDLDQLRIMVDNYKEMVKEWS